jgi:hypothetical protein
MGYLDNLCLNVALGETFVVVLRWGTDVLTSVPVTGITNAAPAVITADGHGMVTGWRASVVSAGGMNQINTNNYPPRERDWEAVSVLSSNTVALNDVNSAGYQPYTSGGFLVYSTPVVLTGATAVMNILDNPNPEVGNVLLSLTNGSGITVDPVGMTITPSFSTVGLTWTTGYFSLQITLASGVTTQVAAGTITIN